VYSIYFKNRTDLNSDDNNNFQGIATTKQHHRKTKQLKKEDDEKKRIGEQKEKEEEKIELELRTLNDNRKHHNCIFFFKSNPRNYNEEEA
jgi:hypothetical protein